MILFWNQRTAAPTTGDLRWTKTTHGGYNKCIAIDSSTGWVMPNCTGYAWGRWLEILETTTHNLYTGNGGSWYGHTSDGYSRGSTPQLGAIVCFSGGSDGAGHVAVVESIASDGNSIITTNSAYGSTNFYRQTLYRSNNWTWSSSYTFQGFIYLPENITGGDIAILNQDKKKVRVNIR